MSIYAPVSSEADEPRTVRNFIGTGSRSMSTAAPVVGDTVFPGPSLPEVGGEFVGFRLERELGRGSFGRVYLAAQAELGGRAVALKVTVEQTNESVSLARLQHTNIVPVYSAHHDRGLFAVCMPYFGGTTLADALRRCRSRRPASGAELADLLRGLVAERAAASLPAHGREGAAAVFDRLATLTFPQAVCWLLGRVTDGLAHAHERGIIHRDVKPANVLLTDDGQPMLLDFGVAADLRARAVVDTTGGTVPYMAPEQLATLFSTPAPPDPRSDVYAVGVMLYEWLAGAHPFSPPGTNLETDLSRLLDERRRWVPRLCATTPDVPPDLEAIVRRCVTADPARRYQSAADLGEDLRRYLAYEPLRTAAEPGGWWRLTKWRRRHPKLGGQLLTAGGVAAGLALCATAGVAWHQLAQAGAEQATQAAATARERERLDATERLAGLHAELRAGRYRLTGRVSEPRATRADLEGVRNAVAGYGLPHDPEWRVGVAVAALPPGQKLELCVALSEACLLLARVSLDSDDAADAERWNDLAEDVRPGPSPRAVFSQRAAIHSRLGRLDDAELLSEQVASTPLLTAEDHFLSGEEAVAARRYADALPLLRSAVRLDPTHFWAQLLLGVCHQRIGRASEARACYTAAIALRPDSWWGYYNRALATVSLQNPAEVVADLDVVLKMEPSHAPALLHRAHALMQINQRERAVADLNAVLTAPDPGGMHVRAFLQRAKWKQQEKDTTGAAADTAAALQLTPADEVGWVLRGLARADSDPVGALADIEEAVRLNPQYVTALRNQVYVLEKLKRYPEAVAVMERVIPLAPYDTSLLANRAVLYARVGKAEQALRDTAAAVARERGMSSVRISSLTTYALLCVEKPELKLEAVKLLQELTKEGHTRPDLAHDPDFAALHNEPAFRKFTAKK
ncbi:MAG: protein kinase [Fimbriiglobus sp.]|nr:protein kinase [Fimbriiglobus sp.]